MEQSVINFNALGFNILGMNSIVYNSPCGDNKKCGIGYCDDRCSAGCYCCSPDIKTVSKYYYNY